MSIIIPSTIGAPIGEVRDANGCILFNVGRMGILMDADEAVAMSDALAEAAASARAYELARVLPGRKVAA